MASVKHLGSHILLDKFTKLQLYSVLLYLVEATFTLVDLSWLLVLAILLKWELMSKEPLVWECVLEWSDYAVDMGLLEELDKESGIYSLEWSYDK